MPASNGRFGGKMATTILFLFLVPCVLCLRMNSPSISRVSPPVLAEEGADAEMDCQVQHATEYPVLWLKLPRSCEDEASSSSSSFFDPGCTPTPLSSGSALIVRDERFSMRYDTVSSTFTLRIKDVRGEDEATYQCQIIVGINNKVTRHVQLQVSSPPVISERLSTASVVAVRENSPAELVCQATGAPNPSVTWRREDGGPLPTGGILHEGSVLEIPRAERGHRGGYVCSAENGVGRATNRKVVLKVEFEPSVRLVGGKRGITVVGDGSGPAALGQALGYPVELTCRVEAHPKPQITWLHDGVEVSGDVSYSVTSGHTNEEDLTESRITIKELGTNQVGNYACRAINKIGTSRGSVRVALQASPNCAVGRCNSEGGEAAAASSTAAAAASGAAASGIAAVKNAFLLAGALALVRKRWW